MTDTTTRNLAREVAEALVSIGKLKYLLPHADYPNDLNSCARDLTREGYHFELSWRDGRWLACYKEKVDRKHWEAIIETIKTDENPAVAWCEAFLGLKKYVDGQLAKGEQS